jgi:predicted dithiol-disulfide oxidoreductase (DUF899 family)
MTSHLVGSPEEHLQARLALLAAEKEYTRRGDDLARQRRQLPWVRVEKNYVFDTVAGERTLADLFDGRSQLLVYHFMFGPEWSEGCPVCSYWADNFDNAIVHLNHRDINFTHDAFGPEMPGLSAFSLDGTDVYHTYSCYSRGLDGFNGGNQLLDRAPRGRDEDDLPVPIAWLRRHDEYEPAATATR